MMDKKKQIEEMANIIALKAFERAHEINGDENLADIVATELYNNGYCLASEVAREIFGEVEEMLNMQVLIARKMRDCEINAEQPEMSLIAMLEGGIYSLRVVEKHIAELKKKYTEEGK